MANELPIWDIILAAGPVVKAVMLLLFLGSIVVWAIVFAKVWQYRKVKKSNRFFLDEFWGESDLSRLYANGLGDSRKLGVHQLFDAGFKEFVRLRKQEGITPESLLEGVERAMRITFSRNAESLNESLPMLATIGSASPYIGLFGTVWGIMTAFQAIGQMQQATLASVAPGMAEALIATAMGLFAAIPAVIFYNRLVARADQILAEYELFADEFLAILHRQSFVALENK